MTEPVDAFVEQVDFGFKANFGSTSFFRIVRALTKRSLRDGARALGMAEQVQKKRGKVGERGMPA